MDIKTFDYILDNVKDDLQGCYNFRNCIATEEKLTFTFRYAVVKVIKDKQDFDLHKGKYYKT